MRALTLSILLVAAPVVSAGTSRYTTFVDLPSVDFACRPLALIPETSEIPGPMQDAAISTANCMVMARTRGLALGADAASVSALDAAVAPAIRILDRVIALGDAEHVLLARYAKLDILVGNTARLLATVPRISATMTANDAYEHDKQVRIADALTEPWRSREAAQRRALARFVYQHPELAGRDPVLGYVIAHSRMAEAAGVAAR